ncbi:hypothetical protein LM600918_270134 [Listeria monocytogenes]|nr:hypothetical protein LM600444_10378 [Listeria monocytogenes]CUK65394.1 hypothetical protein LM600918_270134 [Listeria monocytogenes]CUK74728.1 hypothetical protein LM601598_10386 [Listeria monocytogenes]CUK91144.1 hypothetical protein LM701042_10378 [Listeria monocytogenes]
MGSFISSGNTIEKCSFFTTLLFFDSSGISRLTAIFITSNCWYYLAYAHYNTERRMDKLVNCVMLTLTYTVFFCMCVIQV